jgi:hypothetical protein
MNKPLSFALVAIGIVLLVLAFFAGDSVSSEFSKLFKGTPDNRTIVLGVLGFLALLAGGMSLSRTRT